LKRLDLNLKLLLYQKCNVVIVPALNAFNCATKWQILADLKKNFGW
jgi:hypothetical protein